ncbi:LptF/LptG family permease [candidate division WOR-3 bacterium]|nr:LptF/LptG family permease [candidate division WOR-3 bacterium]
MKTLDRYILRNYIYPLILGFCLFTFIFLMSRLFELLDLSITRGVSGGYTAMIFLSSIPYLISLTIPMAHVFAGIMTFGNFANGNETVAFKSLGINFYRLLKPLFYFTLVIMSLLIVFNNTILPNSNHKLKNLMLNIYKFKPTYQLEEGVFTKNFGHYSFFIEKINRKDDSMKNVYIYEEENGYVKRIIMAKGGKIINGARSDTLWLLLYDGTIHDFDKYHNEYHIVNFKKQNFILPIKENVNSSKSSYRGDHELDIWQLIERIKTTKKQMNRSINQKHNTFMITHYKRSLNRLYLEIYKKISIPLTSIFLLFMGAGIGAMMKNVNIGLSLTISLGIYGVFYVMMIGGESLSSMGYINPLIAAITPLFVFALATVVIISHVINKYSIIKYFTRRKH